MIDLKQFCASDQNYGRVHLSKPFTLDEWTYYTDGRIIVRVPKIADAPVLASPVPAATNPSPDRVRGLFRELTGGAWHTVPLPLPEPIMEPCEECQFCVHDQEDKCEHKEESPAESIKVGNKTLAVKFLRMIAALPNAEINPTCSDKLDVMPFRFEGGEGRLMPMRE